PTPTSTLSPYTTLFRSARSIVPAIDQHRLCYGQDQRSCRLHRSRYAPPPIESTCTMTTFAHCGNGGNAAALDRGRWPHYSRIAADRKSTRLNSSHLVIS